MSKRVDQETQDGSPNKIDQVEIIRQIWKMVIEEKIKPSMGPFKWLSALFNMHKRGFLYTIIKDNKVDLAVAGWRIPKVTDKDLREVPVKDEGKIFYIPFYIPSTRPLPRSSVRKFFRGMDIEKIVFQKDDNTLKEYKMYKRR